MKNIIIITLTLAILLAVGWYALLRPNTTEVVQEEPTTTTSDAEPASTELPEEDEAVSSEATDSDTAVEPESEAVAPIGQSVENRPIMVHRFGTGPTDVLLVGGIHGAYSPNTSRLLERFISHAETNPDFVPGGITLHVIPTLNLDGLATGESPAGRFNANGVDLNRNFDCEWAPEGVWREQTVSGGTEPFSEPEAAALRDYVLELEPEAAIVYYAADGGVYASNCRNGVSTATLELTNTYAQASDYTANESFDFYQITGDAVNWMAKENIPAISVLLSNYDDLEWEQNRAGVAAVFDVFAE